MIPKIIHYCWFGRNPLPEDAVKCIESWQKFLPDYEIRRWDESNFDIDSTVYTAEAYRKKRYAFVSDYVRFWALYNYGGIYFDTDVELIRPIDDIIERGCFMGYEQGFGKQRPNVGLGIGFSAKHVFLNRILQYYNITSYIVNVRADIVVTVVDVVESLLKEYDIVHLADGVDRIGENIYIYPKEYFSPMEWETRKMCITDKTRSIHWYNASWMPFIKEGRLSVCDKVNNILIRYQVKFIFFCKRLYKRLR